MASGSLKDTVKGLNQVFGEPRCSLPLPEELLQGIGAFLDAHPNIDNTDSQRLQDELLKLYNKHVIHAPEKHGAFVNVLRHLRPAITGEARLEQWWKLVIQPTIDAVGHKRETIEDARSFLLSVLVFDEDEHAAAERAATSAHFTGRLLDAYLKRTRIPRGDAAVISPEDDFIGHELEAILIAFGRKRPKELLCAIDQLFVQKDLRAQALGLLSSFVRLQPPHLHLVAQTDLIEHLLQCLLMDTSATVVDLAVTILIMFIPHISSSLVTHLPTMLLIYSRLICWDALATRTERANSRDDDGLAMDDMDSPAESQGWQVLTSAFDNAESANPRVDYFFTFLYGLFPINLMAFIRKPRKYLKTAKFPGADELDIKQDMVRTRTEPHRQVHLLHPNFYLTTQEEELNENRWIKADAADIVTECLSLCTAISVMLKDPGPPPTSKLPPLPKLPGGKPSASSDNLTSVMDDEMASPSEAHSNSWRNTQSTAMTAYSSTSWQNEPLPRPPKSRANSSHTQARSSRDASPARSREAPPDSPTLKPQQRHAHTSVATAEIPLHLLDEQKRPSQSTTPTLTTPGLASFTQALSAVQFPVPPSRSPPPSSRMASLQRENMLLRNDLNFERYLKQQHLSHVGQLQRKHIREATVEAETQNLLNNNRTLKAKLIKANQQYEQLKKETTTSRSQSKKFEAELTSKVRSYREEERQWHTDDEKLRSECETLRKDCENLRRLLVESEQREFNMSNQLQMRKAEIEELDSLRREVQGLQERLRDYEQRELHFEQAEEDRDALQTELEALKMRSASREADQERNRRSLEMKLKDYEAKLASSRPVSQVFQGGQMPASVQHMLDSALAASQSRFNQLKKAHTRLLHKYTELEMRFSELDSGRDFEPPSAHPFSGPRGHDFDPPPPSSSNGLQSSLSASRRPPGFSESLMAEADDIMSADYAGAAQNFAAPGQWARGGAGEMPARFDTLTTRQQAMERAREKESQMESNMSGFLSYNPTKPLSTGHHHMSSARSTTSADSGGSGGAARPRDKAKPEVQVRMYGRGGAQNVSKSKSSKTNGDSKSKGGLKGIRGIM